MSALSTLRTVCFGVTSVVVNKWISSTVPLEVATMRAEITPGNVASSSSARCMGRTLPAIDEESGGAELLAGSDNSNSGVEAD